MKILAGSAVSGERFVNVYCGTGVLIAQVAYDRGIAIFQNLQSSDHAYQ